MKTEQQRVKEKIDKFMKGYVDRQVYGWKPEMDAEYQAQKEAESPKEKETYIEYGRVPLWCPKCKNIMSKRLDTKMYWIHGMCLDCVAKMETQLRIEGKWEEYQRNKIKENIRSYIKETEQQVAEQKRTLDNGLSVVNVVNEQLGSIEYEKWHLNQEEIKEHKQRMDDILKMMHEDFEKAFGEKVHVEKTS